MNIKTFASTMLLCASAIWTASADSVSLVDQQTDALLKSHKVVLIDGNRDDAAAQAAIDSLRERISVFYYDQFRHFSDPAAPYFMFMSRDANLAMGVGGCVRMRGYFDWDGAMPGAGFAPMLIPMNPSPDDMRHLGTTPSGSSLFFRVIGRNKTLGEYQLYIEGNFNGYQGRGFTLKKAYAIVRDFTIGYASSTFSDPAATPPTVDAQGPNNKASATSVLVRYMPTFRNRWTVAVSVESPDPSIAADDVDTKKISNWMPDFAAFLQYGWGRSEHVRLAGIMRTLSYRDLLTQHNYYTIGWGMQLSTVVHPLPQLTTYATLNYGHGFQSLVGDMSIGSYDLVGQPDAPGRLYAPASLGWCVGLQYNLRPNLFMCVSASQNRYLPAHEVSADEYRYGMFGALNVFWNPTPRIQLGAEIDLGRRNEFSGAHRTAHRVGAMAQFSF